MKTLILVVSASLFWITAQAQEATTKRFQFGGYYFQNIITNNNLNNGLGGQGGLTARYFLNKAQKLAITGQVGYGYLLADDYLLNGQVGNLQSSHVALNFGVMTRLKKQLGFEFGVRNRLLVNAQFGQNPIQNVRDALSGTQSVFSGFLYEIKLRKRTWLGIVLSYETGVSKFDEANDQPFQRFTFGTYVLH